MLTDGLPAVVIEGPRAVGKTETALRRARTVHRLDDGRQLAVVRGDPERLLAGRPPILIDEWQRYPDSWDMVRRRVDADPGTARFLLTGSAAPATRPTHSGAGRMVTLRMRPMSLAERGITEPTVSLAELLSGSRPPLAGRSAMKLSDYALEIERSGFPAIRELDRGLRERQIGSYLDRVVEHDIAELGAGVRDRASLRRWLEAFAAATATTAAYTSIRDAATPGAGDPPSMATVAVYRRVMEQMWIVEELPAWLPTRSRLRRLAASPKHHLADPALAMSSLGIGAEALLDGIATPQATQRDGTLLGHLFESLVAQSVRVYAQASRARVSHPTCSTPQSSAPATRPTAAETASESSPQRCSALRSPTVGGSPSTAPTWSGSPTSGRPQWGSTRASATGCLGCRKPTSQGVENQHSWMSKIGSMVR